MPKAKAMSMDGVILRPNMNVVTINTNNSGRSWYLKAERVVEVSSDASMVRLAGDRNCVVVMLGIESRIYFHPDRAVREMRKRNKVGALEHLEEINRQVMEAEELAGESARPHPF